MAVYIEPVMNTKRMKIMGYVVAYLSLVPCDGMADIVGIRAADKIIETKRDDIASSQLGKPTIERCLEFPDFSIVEIDSGQLGADRIAVRLNRCNAHFRGNEQILNNAYGFVAGIVKNFIFVVGPDPFGMESQLAIYDARSGQPLIEANYNSGRDFRVVAKADTLSLSYHHMLKVTCRLDRQIDACWNQIRSENHIPDSVKLPAPDCSTVYKSKKFKDEPMLAIFPNAVQVSVPVHVDDSRAPHLVYEDGTAICAVTP